jgi:demethylmenaquinone methyltransferase/2-methoxy-6-polyprenyl-1,4-benzoquinol methylase
VPRVSDVLPPVTEKPRFVAEMFGRIAPRYDLMNTLMTFGQDSRWRRFVADAAVSENHSVLSTQYSVLDVGTGTGRLAEAVLDADPDAHVVGVDFTLGMLRRASTRLKVVAADALQLPFENNQFDAIVSGFLVRNLANVDTGIGEQIRVLKAGGVLVILETTPGPSGVLQILYRLYFRHVVPVVGRLIAGDASAYTYLPESTLKFLEPARLASKLREHGLREVHTRRLALGCVAITCGRKLLAQEANV